MTTLFDPYRTALVVDPQEPHPEIEQFVERNVLTDAKRYSIHKLDDLSAAVAEGRYSSVVFPSIGVAIRGIWEGDIDFPRWQERGVAVHYIAPAPVATNQHLALMSDEWRGWNAARRRRNAVAGAVLSAFVLAAAFLINWFYVTKR